MPANFRLICADYQHALRTLVAAAPVSTERVLKSEAGIILKTCAARTKVAVADKITTNERLRIVKDLGFAHGRGDVLPEGHISINVGIRGEYGKVWQNVTKTRTDKHGPKGSWGWQQTHGPGFDALNRHFGAGRWAALKSAVSQFKAAARSRVPMAKKSAGLARQSWVQIADSLGIRLEDVKGSRLSDAGLAKARAAMTSKGQKVTNGFSISSRKGQDSFIRLINRLPYGPKAGLDSILAWTLAGRTAYFEQNMARGVFGDMEKILRAYPNLLIRL